MAFSPHGWLVASAGEDRRLILGDVRDGTTVRRLPLGQPVRSVAWSGSLLCVAAPTVVMLEF